MYPLAAAIIGKRFRSMPSMNASTVPVQYTRVAMVPVGVRRRCRRVVSRFSSSPAPPLARDRDTCCKIQYSRRRCDDHARRSRSRLFFVAADPDITVSSQSKNQ